MAAERQFYGMHGIGKWDAGTGRYVPIGGGSRSRLELAIKGLRPYRGFRGVDSLDTVKIDSISLLYAKLEEGLEKIERGNAYLFAPEASPENERQASMAAKPEVEPEAPVAVEPEVQEEAPVAVEPEVQEEARAEVEVQVEQEVAAQEDPLTSMQPQGGEEVAGPSTWGIPEDFEL